MSAISDIYDYFTPIEDAIAAVFKAAEINCYTPLGEQKLAEEEASARDKDKINFQKKRPRVEIILTPGSAIGRLLPQAGRRVASGHLREQARVAQLIMTLTTANIIEHRAYIAEILFITDDLAHAANNTRLLTKHFLQSIKNTGGSAAYKGEEGNYETTLTFEVAFSVQENAWAAFNLNIKP